MARAWPEYGIQPWRVATFKVSTDPELVAKVTDVIGLHLAAPQNAVVLCVVEKSVATGKVTGHCLPRHRRQDFLRFLRQNPEVGLHLVTDIYAAHKHPAVRTWLAVPRR